METKELREAGQPVYEYEPGALTVGTQSKTITVE